MSNWKIVTGEDGKPYFEVDAVALCPQRPGDGPTFLAVTPPGGVATLPVGPNAPAWLQSVVQRAMDFSQEAAKIAVAPRQQGVTPQDFAESRARILEQITQFSLLPGNGLLPGGAWNETPAERPEVPDPTTDTSRWTLDAVAALRSKEWRKANPSLGRATPREDFDDLVNAQGDVVRRDDFEREDAAAAAYMEWPQPVLPETRWASPAPAPSPNQDGLSVTVRRWLPGDEPVDAQKQMGTFPGDAQQGSVIGGIRIVGSPNIPSGMMFATGGSWTISEPEPPPTPGRFQNLDWD